MVVGVLFGVLAICLLLTVPIAVSLGIATIAAGFSLSAVTGNQMLTMLAQTTITASATTAPARQRRSRRPSASCSLMRARSRSAGTQLNLSRWHASGCLPTSRTIRTCTIS